MATSVAATDSFNKGESVDSKSEIDQSKKRKSDNLVTIDSKGGQDLVRTQTDELARLLDKLPKNTVLAAETIQALVNLQGHIKCVYRTCTPRMMWVSEENDAGFVTIVYWPKTAATTERELWIARNLPDGNWGSDGSGYQCGVCAEHELNSDRWYGVLQRANASPSEIYRIDTLKDLNQLKQSFKNFGDKKFETLFSDSPVAVSTAAIMAAAEASIVSDSSTTVPVAAAPNSTTKWSEKDSLHPLVGHSGVGTKEVALTSTPQARAMIAAANAYTGGSSS